MTRAEIFEAIEKERDRQDKLHPSPFDKREFKDENVRMIVNAIMSADFLAVLVEEVGEVGKALQGDGDLKEELIQVASVCVRILEQLK